MKGVIVPRWKVVLAYLAVLVYVVPLCLMVGAVFYSLLREIGGVVVLGILVLVGLSAGMNWGLRILHQVWDFWDA
jgi:hypothetical protein